MKQLFRHPTEESTAVHLECEAVRELAKQQDTFRNSCCTRAVMVHHRLNNQLTQDDEECHLLGCYTVWLL
jgi:hypothetical protein